MIVLLIIVYAAFISLGLPDSLLGSAWPSMYEGFGVPVSNAGIASMIIAVGTVVSSLNSNRLITRFGTAPVTIISVGMTSAALLGISFAPSFWVLCLCSIPLGLGAGSIDAALNNFVALHYKAAHMNWLHSFWGVGASIGPIILAYFLRSSGLWTTGYRVISIIQAALMVILIVSLPLWKRVPGTMPQTEDQKEKNYFGLIQLLKLPKAKVTLISFFCYCAIESTVGLWGSSYLVLIRHIDAKTAAAWIALYYFGITLGRMLSGFLSLKLTQKMMIRLGLVSISLGIIVLFLPFTGNMLLAGFFLIGLGCAPIFPSLLHETPRTFGKDASQAMMGTQMASAYIGTTCMPPLFGLLGKYAGYALFPFYLTIILVLMILMVYLIYRNNVKK
ncbi:MAG: MFS transporter [Treponema sp.]|nr:MFS transporter [Treponema sp.]